MGFTHSLLLLQAWVHIHFLLFKTLSSSCTEDYYYYLKKKKMRRTKERKPKWVHLQNHIVNHAGRETLCLHSFLQKNMLPRACVHSFRHCLLFSPHPFSSLIWFILNCYFNRYYYLFFKDIASSAYVVCVIYVWRNLRMASHVKFFHSAFNHIFHSNCWLKKKLTCPICHV